MILTVVWFLLPCHVRPIFNSSTTLCVTPRYFLHRRWLHRRWLTLALNLKMSLTLTLTITLTLTLTLTLTRRTCLSAVMPHMIRSISLLLSVLLTLIRPLRAFYPDLPLTKGCYNNHATFYTCGGYTCSGFTIGFTFTGRSRISKGCLRMLLVFAFLSARDRTLGLRYTVHIM